MPVRVRIDKALIAQAADAARSADAILQFLARQFARHFVPIYFHASKGSEVVQVAHSAFAFSINGRWLLLTAGHCVREMLDAQRFGYVIEHCRLVHGLGEGAQYVPLVMDRRDGCEGVFMKDTVQFNYSGDNAKVVFDDDKWDYGVLFISDNERGLLQAKGIVPFDESTWDEEPVEANWFHLLGTPGELLDVNSHSVSLVTVRMGLVKLAEKPDDFPVTDSPRFYGRLHELPPFRLKGMSGGPILNAMPDPEDPHQVLYWLHALDVSTLPRNQQYISAMLIRPAVDELRALAAGR